MRHDMAKVVTERPRSGHGNPSRKWGRRLNPNEFDLDDHGTARAPIARRRQYSDWKAFSDLLGPLRRYLRKQVGRPWDKVWSEITRSLDSRSLTGQHIFDHIRWEVEQEAWIAENGRVCRSRRWRANALVEGLYVHPLTRLLCYKPKPPRQFRGGDFLKAQAALGAFGIPAATAAEILRHRVDGDRVWECREGAWFIHAYRRVPQQVVRSVTRSDGREVPIYSPAHYERVATKQASKSEIRRAVRLLEADPLSDTSR
jgi:hypothetical protein